MELTQIERFKIAANNIYKTGNEVEAVLNTQKTFRGFIMTKPRQDYFNLFINGTTEKIYFKDLIFLSKFEEDKENENVEY
jgi:hypothetical protein